ncbi:hypothetical protein [Haloferula sp. A504]|uniref:hypothetical protein n=1 Tax=Haloferula sp. A504 TaxID=3373601 RepID=UPI0031C1131F|nr:hypothetical protein [Verrucomicrobiaceae bacterium E54]
MLSETEGLADLGLWQDAWDALEALPAEERATPAALRVRLRCCPGVGAWEIGEHLAGVLCDGKDSDRESAAGFYHALAVFHARAGRVEGARDSITAAASAWPDIRAAMLDDPALEGSLFGEKGQQDDRDFRC